LLHRILPKLSTETSHPPLPPRNDKPPGKRKRSSQPFKTQTPKKKARKLKPFEKSNGIKVEDFKDQMDVIVVGTVSEEGSNESMSMSETSDDRLLSEAVRTTNTGGREHGHPAYLWRTPRTTTYWTMLSVVSLMSRTFYHTCRVQVDQPERTIYLSANAKRRSILHNRRRISAIGDIIPLHSRLSEPRRDYLCAWDLRFDGASRIDTHLWDTNLIILHSTSH